MSMSNRLPYTDEELVADIERLGVVEEGMAEHCWHEDDETLRRWLAERAVMRLFLTGENMSQRAMRLRGWLLDHPLTDEVGDEEIEATPSG